MQYKIFAALFSILFLLSCCEALAPAIDLTNNHGVPRNGRSGRHIPIKEVMGQFTDSRVRRDGGSPSFYTRDLNDTHNYALPVYSGIVNSEVIFVLTYDIGGGTISSSRVYRSDDYGKTFEDISSKIGNGAPLVPLVSIGPNDHRKVYFVDARTPTLYVSTNAAVDFTTVTLSPSTIDPFSITPHDTEDNWLLGQDSTNNALYVSRDLGSTECMKIADNVTSGDRYQWGTYPFDPDNSTVYFLSNKVLYYQQYPYGRDNQKRFGPMLEFNDFLAIDRYFFLEYLVNDTTSEYDLWMSADRRPFQRANVPNDNLGGHFQYIVASVKALQALLILRHGNGQYNLYLSDESGVYFSESLARLAVIEVVPNAVYYIDLEVAMNWTTYVANQIVEGGLRTLISFDAGGNWHTITPPDNSTGCSLPLCSLHFHLDTSNIWRVTVRDRASAPGILLALGGTGRYYNSSLGDMYISRDGGFTWSLTLEGLWDAEILDRGSLIVATPYYRSEVNGSRSLMYSCNEGKSWSSLIYTDTLVHTAGLRTEPGETTTVVTLYGVHPDTFSWVLSVVDFNNIFPSECGDDDYYNWTPYDKYSDNGCYLGALVTIERRKQDVCCLNTREYVRIVDYNICPCTLEDYQCDYGYKPVDGFGSVCVRDDRVTLNSTCANGQDYYRQSLGYRKLGGDVCAGGIEDGLLASNQSCAVSGNTTRNTTTSSSSSDKPYRAPFQAVIVLLVIAILMIIILVVAVIVLCIRSSSRVSATENKRFQHEEFVDTNSAYSVDASAPEKGESHRF